MFCICSERWIGSGRIVEEFWKVLYFKVSDRRTVEQVKKNAATVAMSEGVEKTDFTITERSLSDKSFDYQG
jgi:hypothetical protein